VPDALGWWWVGFSLEESGGRWRSRSPSLVGYRELIELYDGKAYGLDFEPATTEGDT
jgi:hypothetical protein